LTSAILFIRITFRPEDRTRIAEAGWIAEADWIAEAGWIAGWNLK
jgi:hypothetical protein